MLKNIFPTELPAAAQLSAAAELPFVTQLAVIELPVHKYYFSPAPFYYNYIAYIVSMSNVHQLIIPRCDYLGEFIELANNAAIECAPGVYFTFDEDSDSSFIVHFHVKADSLIVSSTIGIFNENAHCISAIGNGCCVRIPLGSFFWKLQEQPLYYIVPNDIHICSVHAEIYRKKEAGLYERYEEVCLPSGFYNDISELAAALTQNLRMKGERNGDVYMFEVSAKSMVLRLIAHHRQPTGSTLRLMVADGSKAAGLFQSGQMTLGNRKFIDFDYTPNTLIHI
jgi:hypothetical protein